MLPVPPPVARAAAVAALAVACLAHTAFAQAPAATLKLSWDHCAGDGAVADRSFACDTNTGGEVLYASLVITDGVERAGISGFSAIVDITSTATLLPLWWHARAGDCRAQAIGANFGPYPAGETCEPWYANTGIEAPLGVYSLQPGFGGPDKLNITMAAAVPAGSEATLPAGRELLLFKVTISHAKSTGTGACAGCLVPTCLGFGDLRLQHAPSTTPDEEFLGGPGSAVTWQGAYVAGYAPVPGHREGLGWVPYYGYLSCTTGPVPAQNRTWGTIKTLYH